MKVLCLLFALVSLVVADRTVGESGCPNRTWDANKDDYRHRCVHFCPNGDGWIMGYFLNFTKCWYNENMNGTCYNGLCYKELPEGVTLPSSTASNEVITADNPTENPHYAAPTTTERSTTTQSKKKKEEEDASEQDKKKEQKKKKKKKKGEEDHKNEEKDKQKKKKKKKKQEIQEW